MAVTKIALGWSTSLLTILASRFLGRFSPSVTLIQDSIHDDYSRWIGSRKHCRVPLQLVEITDDTRYLSWPVFVDRLYLPPCVISAVCALLGMGLRYLFIQETLPSKRKAEAESASDKALLAIPALRALTLSGLTLNFLSSTLDVVFTLFCYTPVDAAPSTIGNFLAFSGTFAVLLWLVVMPYIIRRFGYATTYNTCMYIWPTTFASLPLFNALALARRPEVGIWIGLPFVLTLSKVAAIPHSITMLLIKRHAPGRGSALGRSNGLYQFTMCLGRADGPVVVNVLFTALNGSTRARRWCVGWEYSVVMVCFAVVG
ncbi:hypothetical protein J3R83DRAFT_5693 [Lanmaoa asiatica]|nr:hypothetical protein J3R83DRAFT_5693 [Lanmaoa asiatica]